MAAIKLHALEPEALSILGVKIISWIIIFLTPIHGALFACGFLVMSDFITGIWASIKSGRKINSKGFRQTVVKTFVYLGAITFAFIVETNLIGDLVPILKITTGLIGLTELTSIFENFKIISGLDLFKMLILKLNPPKDQEKD